MPTDYDRDVYAQPPTKSAVVDRGPYDLTKLLVKAFYYVVDLPVTTLHDWISTQQQKNKIYYYHRRVNRVPDITQCIVGDYICQYEAEVQWHRDWLVDKEIVKVVQERLQACHVREGPDSEEMCREDVEKFEKAMKAFNCRYGELGALATARSSLMKQKERMIKERQQQQEGAFKKACSTTVLNRN